MSIKPEITPENAAFWTGGKTGQLLIARCQNCALAIHPPQLICPACYGRNVMPQPVSGRGIIYSYTINHQPWTPDMTVPFAIAVVDVEGAEGVRLTGQMRSENLDSVHIGQSVVVDFEQLDDDLFIPFWRDEAER